MTTTELSAQQSLFLFLGEGFFFFALFILIVCILDQTRALISRINNRAPNQNNNDDLDIVRSINRSNKKMKVVPLNDNLRIAVDPLGLPLLAIEDKVYTPRLGVSQQTATPRIYQTEYNINNNQQEKNSNDQSNTLV